MGQRPYKEGILKSMQGTRYLKFSNSLPDFQDLEGAKFGKIVLLYFYKVKIFGLEEHRGWGIMLCADVGTIAETK